jgi:phosphorylase/glycogen(starch) synthase
MEKRKEFLFEISWEVCNKVGGIHTVITSKLLETEEHFENYFLMGIYKKENKKFIENDIPNIYLRPYEELLKIGIKLHFGKWDVETDPNVILVEYLSYSHNLNDIKKKLWELYKIDSLNSNWYDFDETILWSWTCGIAIEKLSSCIDEKILVHSHEWMSGGAILYIKSLNSKKIGTIFTTHATMLGRSLSGSGFDIYSNIDKIDPNKSSYDLNIQAKHQTEKTLANISDVFTTVSHITNIEAEKFYNKKADILLFNGFDIKNRSFNYYLNSFNKSRYIINEFLQGYFYNYYPINLDNTQILYTSGRYEIRNKGIDLMIDALGKLNEKLKNTNDSKNIICFFLIPFGNFERNKDLLNSLYFYKRKKENKRNNFPPLSTHNIPDDNEILNMFFKNSLINRETDKVKVIFVPTYLDGKDSFFNMQYYDIISGMDLGIFASYYEPWGYTPLESISHGVPAITSDLAGFGRYCSKEEGCKSAKALKRFGQSYQNSKEELLESIEDFLSMNQKEVHHLKEIAINYSKEFSWEEFYKNYLRAYDLVLKKISNNQ